MSFSNNLKDVYDFTGPFPKKDIHTDENLQSEHDKHEEPMHIESSIEIGNFRNFEILRRLYDHSSA